MSDTSRDNSFTVSSDFRIRDTAKKHYKYARWNQTQSQQFSIDTAAIATAFPDFTQGSTSDGTIFGKNDSQQLPARRVQDTSFQTLPKSQTSKDIHFNTIKNTTDMLRTTSMAANPNSSPYVSNASRTTSGERKQLAELRAQVQSDTENSTMGTERTSTFPTSKPRGSRFANNKADSQQTPANISARFTSPAKSVTRSGAQPTPTQTSFIIQAGGDMTGRDMEDSGLPVIVEHGEIQERKSSARRFRRVSAIRTPEEEEEIWLLAEKLKAENAALKSQAAYQHHVNHNLHEQNEKAIRELAEFRTKMTSDFDVKFTEMSRRMDMVMSENTSMKEENAAIKANTAALSHRKEVEAHEISRLETELARLRTNIQETNTDLQFELPNPKPQNSPSRTIRRESRVEFTNNTDVRFEQGQSKAQSTAQTSRPQSGYDTQGTNTDMTVEITNLKPQNATTRSIRSESRGEFQGVNTNTNVQFENTRTKTQKTSTQTVRPDSHVEFQGTNTGMSFDVQPKLRTRKAQPFRPRSAAEEPTLRPSVDPEQALAIVMSQLNEEIARLKEEYQQVESQYMALDPAVKKRMRKELKTEMDRVMQLIDRKCDQVYLLQDVQEGILPYEVGQD
ncbi:uncharacterized protein PAC_05639 [Phialocephala subalpina]|uniref:Cep57 centrosome microtubule-binding domain-containing protein n=1 Tax=Phialocephala subalpina TaxID=576137 RepID=A0A1L7WSJ7_9HELO|nr:uncharacterized protein PAC_05639 [Phialocephala subalpina]